MLNCLFARNVPEDRVQDAVDHGNAVEQRDALRERSAVILDRLERKRTELRRIELEERQAAKDAADRAALEAETAVEATAATEATAVAETGMVSETGPGDTDAVEATAPEATATGTSVAGNFAVEAAETGQATGDYQPVPDGEETAAAFSSETTTAADSHFSESEPLRQHEAMQAETDYADERATGMTETPATDFGAVDAETPEADYPDVASDLPATVTRRVPKKRPAIGRMPFTRHRPIPSPRKTPKSWKRSAGKPRRHAPASRRGWNRCRPGRAATPAMAPNGSISAGTRRRCSTRATTDPTDNHIPDLRRMTSGVAP